MHSLSSGAFHLQKFEMICLETMQSTKTLLAMSFLFPSSRPARPVAPLMISFSSSSSVNRICSGIWASGEESRTENSLGRAQRDHLC